jgi:hypothetical protein
MLLILSGDKVVKEFDVSGIDSLGLSCINGGKSIERFKEEVMKNFGKLDMTTIGIIQECYDVDGAWLQLVMRNADGVDVWVS